MAFNETKYCCCCCSVTFGTALLIWVSSIHWGPYAVYYLWTLQDTNYYFGIKSVVICGCCILGMYAVVKRNAPFLYPYLIYRTLIVITYSCEIMLLGLQFPECKFFKNIVEKYPLLYTTLIVGNIFLQVYFIRVVILCMEDLESECQRIHYLDNFAASASYYTRSFKPESNPPPYTSISGVAVPVHTSASVLSHNPPPYAPSLNNIGMSVYETSSLLNPAASVSQYGLLSR